MSEIAEEKKLPVSQQLDGLAELHNLPEDHEVRLTSNALKSAASDFLHVGGPQSSEKFADAMRRAVFVHQCFVAASSDAQSH